MERKGSFPVKMLVITDEKKVLAIAGIMGENIQVSRMTPLMCFLSVHILDLKV